MTIPTWSILLGAYLLGALPTAHLVARRARMDLRQIGDGNLGARNAHLQIGPAAGLIIALTDVCKGMGAALLARQLAPTEGIMYLTGIAAAVGHNYSVFMRFRGGQGMATSLGVLVIYQPLETLIGTLTAWLAYRLSRRWDLSWSLGLFLLPASGLVMRRSLPEVVYACAQLATVGIKKVLDTPLRRRLRRLNNQ